MSDNSTTTSLPRELSVWNYISLVSFVLVLVVGIIGNSLVCYVFGYKRKHDRTVTETLYLSLGVVDLMASLLTPLIHIYFTLTFHAKWHFGTIACKIFVPLSPITTTISAGIILMIGLDRYRVIVTPFKRHFSRKQIYAGLVATVVLSIASFAHYIIGVTPRKGGTCQVPQVSNFGFSIPNTVMLFVRDITFLVIFIWINVSIYRALHRREKNATLKLMTNGETSKRGSDIRILMTVGLFFFILILPADVTHLAYTISWLDNDGIPYDTPILLANAFFKILHVANSCINVFIYSRLHNKFRNVLKDKLLRLRGSEGKETYEKTATWELTTGPKENDPFLYHDYSNLCHNQYQLWTFLTNPNAPETDV